MFVDKAVDAEVANALALSLNELADTNKLALIVVNEFNEVLALAVNVLTDEVNVLINEPVAITDELNEFNAVIEDACELFVDNVVDADVLKELALTIKLLALTSKLFISLSEDVVYAVKELAVTCKAENDTNADAVNVFNALMLVEAPQLPESPSIELNLLLTDELNIVTDDVVAYEPVCPPNISNLELTLAVNVLIEAEVFCNWVNLVRTADAEVAKEDADVTKLPLIILRAVIEVLALAVNVFNEAVALFKDADAMFKAVLTFIEPVKPSIEANLLLADWV